MGGAFIIETPMIRTTPELASFEHLDGRTQGAVRTFSDALRVFEAMWAEAVLVCPGFPGDWKDDVEPDLAVARALNESAPHA